MFDYASRRRRLAEQLEAEGIAALFLGPSADLEYLTGVERPAPSFGQPLYQHGWVTGAFFRPGAEPVFVLPRMFATFDLREQPDGEVLVVNEADDGLAIFERAARDAAGAGRLAIGDRIRAETALNLARLLGVDRLQTGSRLVNELRRIKTGEELEAMGRAIARGRDDDGGRDAARRPRRLDGGARRGGRARAARSPARAARRSRPTSSPGSARTTSTPRPAPPGGRSRTAPR